MIKSLNFTLSPDFLSSIHFPILITVISMELTGNAAAKNKERIIAEKLEVKVWSLVFQNNQLDNNIPIPIRITNSYLYLKDVFNKNMATIMKNEDLIIIHESILTPLLLFSDNFTKRYS